jgi:hypothetical protein
MALRSLDQICKIFRSSNEFPVFLYMPVTAQAATTPTTHSGTSRSRRYLAHTPLPSDDDFEEEDDNLEDDEDEDAADESEDDEDEEEDGLFEPQYGYDYGYEEDDDEVEV